MAASAPPVSAGAATGGCRFFASGRRRSYGWDQQSARRVKHFGDYGLVIVVAPGLDEEAGGG